MAANCWQPARDPGATWGEADECGTTNRWTPGEASSAIACVAVACFATACWPKPPEPPPDWQDAADSGEQCVDTLGSATDTGFDKGFS